jgi:hypothetical protein
MSQNDPKLVPRQRASFLLIAYPRCLVRAGASSCQPRRVAFAHYEEGRRLQSAPFKVVRRATLVPAPCLWRAAKRF